MTAILMPNGKQAFANAAGQPLVGGKVYTYAAGTNTPKTTWSDAAQTAANTNPIILDARGEASIFWLGSYKVVLRDANDVIIWTQDNVTAPDLTVFASLAALAQTTNPSGASLIGNLGGGTVQDAIFVKGPAVAVPSTTARIDWKREPSGTAYPVASVAGGLWTDKVSYSHAISADFNNVNAPVNTPLASPAATLLVVSHNTGSDAIALPLQTIGGVNVSGKESTAGNFIVYCDAGLTNVRMKGIEIDIQPGAGSTIIEAFGLAINAFGQMIPGNAIYIEGVFGGYFSSGIRIGALEPTISAGIYGTGTMGTLLDSATGTYGQDAIALTNNHKIRFRGTASVHAKLFMDTSNNLRVVLGTGGFVVRDNTDIVSLISMRASGSDGIVDVSTAAGQYQVNGTKVVGPRDTGWVAMTGTPDKTSVFNTATVSTSQLATRVKYIQDVLTAHGLIGA